MYQYQCKNHSSEVILASKLGFIGSSCDFFLTRLNLPDPRVEEDRLSWRFRFCIKTTIVYQRSKTGLKLPTGEASFVLIISIGFILALLLTWRGGDFGTVGGAILADDTRSRGFEPNRVWELDGCGVF